MGDFSNAEALYILKNCNFCQYRLDVVSAMNFAENQGVKTDGHKKFQQKKSETGVLLKKL